MLHAEPSQPRKYYGANRKRLAAQRAAKFARMRAAKERMRLERLAGGDSQPVGAIPRPPKIKSMRAPVEIRGRIGSRWFCLSAHEAPWGGLMPSAAILVRFVRSALLLA